MEDDVNIEQPVPAEDLPAIEALLASVPWPHGTLDLDGLDDETLAAWAEGNLSAPEAAAVESRLAESDEGRAWIAQVRASQDAATGATAADAEVPPSAGAPSRATKWMPMAAAALLLLAFGVAFALGGFDRPSEDMTLTAAAEDFRKAGYPDFKLLTDEELADMGREVERGGLVALKPRHTVRPEDRRVLEWKASAGIDSYALKLFDSDGREIWQVDAISGSRTEVALPAGLKLPAGTSYVWEVTGDDGFGAQTARAAFRIRTDADIEATRAALVATNTAPKSIQSMLFAQVAIRRGMYTLAEIYLEGELKRPTPHSRAQKLYDFVKRQ